VFVVRVVDPSLTGTQLACASSDASVLCSSAYLAPMHTTLRVLIVEDHPLVASATADLLRKQHPIVSPIVVDSAPAAIEQVACDDWFRIFVDLGVPGASRLSLLRTLRERGVIRRCCVITAIKDDQLVAEARRLGVLGYIEKSWSVEQFCRSLHDIVQGVAVFPVSSERLEPRVPQLTSRQLAVLRLLHQGLSSKQVAHELQIAEGTVKNHSLAVLRALGATNRVHAVARGLELGLLQMPAA
jgi:DNA-binding NarL/FixJ family response regulator